MGEFFFYSENNYHSGCGRSIWSLLCGQVYHPFLLILTWALGTVIVLLFLALILLSQVQGFCIPFSVQISSNVPNICQIPRQYPKLNYV